jgi:hypothetical protein
VTGKRLELQVHRGRDVDHHLRPLPLHQVHLAHLVRLVLGQKFGEGHVIARERIHAVEHDTGRDAVIAVRRVEIVGTMRVLRDDQVRAEAADLSRHVAPELARVLHLTVLVPEELHALDAEHAGGVSLLGLPDRDQAVGRHGAVARALVAVGDDHVRDLAPLLDELRHRAPGPELGVVRMRGDHHHALDAVCHPLSSVAFRSESGYTAAMMSPC